jgi:hypothetical protein
MRSVFDPQANCLSLRAVADPDKSAVLNTEKHISQNTDAGQLDRLKRNPREFDDTQFDLPSQVTPDNCLSKTEWYNKAGSIMSSKDEPDLIETSAALDAAGGDVVFLVRWFPASLSCQLTISA